MAKIDWLLSIPPRAVQLEANRLSYPRSAFAYFMEMRLGKTAALLNEFLLFKRNSGIKRLLVIAPNKYKYGWEIEARKFGVEETIYVFDSKTHKGGQIIADIVIANYEALRSEKHFKALLAFNADMVAFDESVMAKSRTTYAFGEGLKLSNQAKVVRILTGKPVVQGPHDLWSQLRLIRQLDGYNYFAFRNYFCKMGGFMQKQVVGYREETRGQLQALLNTCSFIAKRKDWGKELPTDYEIRSPEILPVQAQHYREMEKDFITYLQSGLPVSADQVITKHIKLQQISSGFIIDENKKVNELIHPSKLPKLVDLLDLLENQITNKTLIICFYIHSLMTLLGQLNEYFPALIAGDRLMKGLGRNVEKEKKFFNEDKKCRVMIAQIQAVKYGHNLSAKGDCDTVVYYENTYSLDDRSQSEQRPQGEEQKVNLHVVDYASTKVEREIIKALQRKESIANAIVRAYD